MVGPGRDCPAPYDVIVTNDISGHMNTRQRAT
ncbi:MAG: hypothetical protein JWM87_531 [Candidatus Eremiobacteraeota bacterium]|nr:hypothetical protein [Candidatus Eremiobacteraeota bacterium]